MEVSRSDVSDRCSIHRERLVTGANAMSASLAGSGVAAAALRTKRSRAGPVDPATNAGFHCVAGETLASIAIFRGPTRRSSSGAIDCRQLAAAISRSGGVSGTRARLSASSKVDAETAGPVTGPVPKVGGAPGVVGAVPLVGAWRRDAAAATPIVAV